VGVIRLLEPGVRVPSLAITRSAPRSLVTLDARSPRNDSATTPTPPTIPRVIISIATVIPVRPRIARDVTPSELARHRPAE
jgi:hypothetical protein